MKNGWKIKVRGGKKVWCLRSLCQIVVLLLKLCPIDLWSNDNIAISWACREMGGKTFYPFRVYCGLQWCDLTDIIDRQKNRGVWASALRDSCGTLGGMKKEYQFSFPQLGVTGALLAIGRETCCHDPEVRPSEQQIPGHWLATRAVALAPSWLLGFSHTTLCFWICWRKEFEGKRFMLQKNGLY